MRAACDSKNTKHTAAKERLPAYRSVKRELSPLLCSLPPWLGADDSVDVAGDGWIGSVALAWSSSSCVVAVSVT